MAVDRFSGVPCLMEPAQLHCENGQNQFGGAVMMHQMGESLKMKKIEEKIRVPGSSKA